jgi:hypothetical protein
MRDEKQKISALMILEVIGKPKEFLTETLENLAKQMDNEQGIVVKSKNIKEPKKMEERSGIVNPAKDGLKIEEQNDFYVSFAEIEIEAENLFNLIFLMFKYMPAHVEISSPEVIALTNNGWNDVLNELIRRLHGYDEIARVLQVEKAILENKLRTELEKQGKSSVAKKSGKDKPKKKK